MRVSDYTKAMVALIEEGKDLTSLLPRLQQVLKTKGHERLYPKILRNLSETLQNTSERKGAEVILARETDGSKYQQGIVEALTKIQATEYTTKIDPTIVGGYIAEGATERVDASHKKALLTLYRSLISKV